MSEADLFLEAYLLHYRYETDHSGRRWRLNVKRFLVTVMADYEPWVGVYAGVMTSVRIKHGKGPGNPEESDG